MNVNLNAEYKKARCQETQVLRELVLLALKGAEHFPWTVQGFGMLRLYLGKVARLHVWHHGLQTENVSVIHNHFWRLRSTVLSGAIENVRYAVRDCDPTGPLQSLAFNPIPSHFSQVLRTGEGGGLVDRPRPVLLTRISRERVPEGESYWQHAQEVHETRFEDGTVTLMERDEGDGDKTATTFWPWHEEWVSAEPRPATREEVRLAVGCALDGWRR